MGLGDGELIHEWRRLTFTAASSPQNFSLVVWSGTSFSCGNRLISRLYVFSGVLRSAKTVRTPIKLYVCGRKWLAHSTFVCISVQYCEFPIQFANSHRPPLFILVASLHWWQFLFLNISNQRIPLLCAYLSNIANFQFNLRRWAFAKPSYSFARKRTWQVPSTMQRSSQPREGLLTLFAIAIRKFVYFDGEPCRDVWRHVWLQ